MAWRSSESDLLDWTSPQYVVSDHQWNAQGAAPSYRTPPPPVSNGPGMDLEAWEKYPRSVIGRSREAGSVKFLIDVKSSFPPSSAG